MANDLIFDIGMHKMEDTAYYLQKGYRVFAVDANPHLIEQARVTYPDAVRAARLVLANCAVAPHNGLTSFYLSASSSLSSINQNLANRDNGETQMTTVSARRLSDLMKEVGVPLYCKIDVEGYDAVCLTTLLGAPELPQFISVEAECNEVAQGFNNKEAVATLETLRELGYTKFKLVDQKSLAVITLSSPNIYRHRPPFWERIRNRIGLGKYSFYHYMDFCSINRSRLLKRHGYEFPHNSSGPFGNDLDGNWLDFREAQETIAYHRRRFWETEGSITWFICDWHATI